MAKRRGVRGWHSMRKDELVRALVKSAKSDSNGSGRTGNGKAKDKKSRSRPKQAAAARSKSSSRKKGQSSAKKSRSKSKSRTTTRKIEAALADREGRKDLADANGKGTRSSKSRSDRIVLMVRDSYWLHAHWELSKQCIERAKAALAEQWHTARPVLRLYEVSSQSTTNSAERVARDIEIHGGVQNWYIDVQNPPNSYLVEIGYLASDGRFHRIARSNSVSTPRPGSANVPDENWADVAANCEKIFALSGGYASETHSGELQQLFEERLKRPMGSPMATRYGIGAERFLDKARQFDLQVDCEMIVHGKTAGNAYVMFGGEPINVESDGTFSVRMDLGNQRQVIPVVAESSDGVEQRTIVIAVERNTKVMEPVVRDPNEI